MTDQSTPSPVTLPVDDPGEMQTGDFGLNGDIANTMASALEQVFNESTADEADGANQPDPADLSSPDENGAGVGGDAPDEGAAPDSAGAPIDPGAAPPSTPPDDFSLDSYARDYFGTNLTRDQAANLFATINGLQNLSPEQRAQLDQALAGGAQGQYPVTAPQQPEQHAPQSPAIPGLPPRPDDEYSAQIYDQMVAPLAQSTNAQIAQLQQEIAANTQRQMEQQRAADTARIEEATNAWRAEHAIVTDGEYDALTQRIVQSGTFPALINAHRGDVQAATRVALDQFFWADETLRARAIANISSGRAAGDSAAVDPSSPVAQQQQELDAGRQARAASVAGGGGSTTSRTSSAPTDKAGRQRAMASEIAAAMEGAN